MLTIPPELLITVIMFGCLFALKWYQLHRAALCSHCGKPHASKQACELPTAAVGMRVHPPSRLMRST